MQAEEVTNAGRGGRSPDGSQYDSAGHPSRDTPLQPYLMNGCRVKDRLQERKKYKAGNEGHREDLTCHGCRRGFLVRASGLEP